MKKKSNEQVPSPVKQLEFFPANETEYDVFLRMLPRKKLLLRKLKVKGYDYTVDPEWSEEEIRYFDVNVILFHPKKISK